ncbi:phosphoribosyltransferase [Nitrosarchaeum sp. AC2]|uniref:phosphoribosyltransferase n=1 Tax=Nitrosarchaeum sp. AC2 TaxID=2259673 RepID=UPI0015CC92EE|nr:phosphoribosyltransferase [Nitrosarchaeum sp. AC2]QLH11122.1 phosphoribosyltransferase [Nitrosarchaeum sp. AC2]
MDTLSQHVTWTDIERLTKLLSKKILKSSKSFSSISTVNRGGLIPARLLADHLGIDTILVDKNKISSDSLFVDDIYDSGKTFKKIIQNVTNPSDFVYATLFARTGKKYPKQLVYAQKTKGTEYIVFPWDTLEYERFKNTAL